MTSLKPLRPVKKHSSTEKVKQGHLSVFCAVVSGGKSKETAKKQHNNKTGTHLGLMSFVQKVNGLNAAV